MKLSKVNSRIILIFIISCAAVIIGILCNYFFAGTILRSINLLEKGSTIENNTPAAPLLIDTNFEIQEANLSLVHNRTIVHVTYDELQVVPDLEKYMHGINNDPKAWVEGWRLVKDFDGNRSQYDTLVSEVCRGKTLTECFGYGGVLFECHGQYYSVSATYVRGPRAVRATPSGGQTTDPDVVLCITENESNSMMIDVNLHIFPIIPVNILTMLPLTFTESGLKMSCQSITEARVSRHTIP